MENIPQIKLENGQSDNMARNRVKVYEVEENAKEESFLIPKLGNEDVKTRKNIRSKSMISPKIFKIIGVLLVIFIVIGSVFGYLGFGVYKKAILFKTSINKLIDSGKSQNLEEIKSNMGSSKVALSDLQKSYKSFSFTKIIPFVGSYYKDGEHALNAAGYGFEAGEIVIDAASPYADIIGFDGGKKAQSGLETAQDRIDFIIKSIPEIIPKIDELSSKVNSLKGEIDQIDPGRYPQKFRGIEIRQKLVNGIETIDSTSELIVDGKPLLENADYLLGVKAPRTYLILFQNDKELRPTGGFLTAYSIAKVEKGRFTPVLSDDMYKLDNNYKPSVAAPDPFYKYLKGPYVLSRKYRLRDMNWSPDFAESMKLFTTEVEKAGITKIDGVVAVDTQMLVNLLDVLGPIGVSGYGEFSTKIVPQCNCPQVIYELESFADVEGPIVWSENEPGKIVYAPANYDNRKKIIGPLMNSILSNTMGQPKDKLPALFEAALKSLTEKHVLLYLFDEKTQNAVYAFGIGGNVKDYDGDYLMINDANLGGRKSNLYVTQEVSQEINVAKDGSVEKTLTITYKNPEKQDGWLNSVLPDWVRIYVPKGSELISMDGFEEKADPYEDLGKTVFAGFFNIRPQGVAQITLKYKLPMKVSSDYKILLQKQAGTDKPLYTIQLGKQEEEFYLNKDKELRLKI
jgi:hypothetical protein